MALLGRKKIGREDHEKKQRRIDRLAEDWEEVGGSFNDSFQSTSSRNSNLSAKVNVSINQNLIKHCSCRILFFFLCLIIQYYFAKFVLKFY